MESRRRRLLCAIVLSTGSIAVLVALSHFSSSKSGVPTFSNAIAKVQSTFWAFQSGDRYNESKSIDSAVNDKLLTEGDMTQVEAILEERARKNYWRGKYLICALANAGHYEFTMNFIMSLRKNGYEKFLILCLDMILYRKLLEHGLRENAAIVPQTWLNSPISTNEVIWDQPEYNALTQAKTLIFCEMLRKGHTIFVNDVDVVWLNPHILPYLDYITPRHVEFIYMLDDLNIVNTGCYIAKPGKLVMTLFRESIERQKTDKRNDQYVMNDIFNEHRMRESDATRPMDKLLFADGRVMWQHGMNRQFGLGPWILHANYLVGKKEKQQKLASANCWYFNETGWKAESSRGVSRDG